MSKRQLLAGICAAVMVVVVLSLWVAVEHAVTIEGASDLVVPMLAAGAFVVSFVLTAILARSGVVLVAAAIAMGLALAIAQSLVLAGAVVFATLLLMLARKNIASEMNLRIRIDIGTAAMAGFGWLVLAISTVISALYFTLLVQHDAASLALSNSLRSVAGSSILRTMMPAPLTTDSKGEVVTVDNFIAHMIDKQMKSASGDKSAQINQSAFLEQYAQALTDRLGSVTSLDSGIGAELKQVIAQKLPQLATGNKSGNAEVDGDVSVSDPVISAVAIAQTRKQLSEQFGMPLTGKEPVADIFVQFAQSQLQGYAESKVLPAGYKFSTALAGVMAVFLFVTISWVGSLLRFVAIPVVRIIFWILRKVHLIEVKLVATEREKLV